MTVKNLFNGHACCLLGLCCPPGSAAQIDALAAWMVESWDCDPGLASIYAKSLLGQADLTPKGLTHGLLKTGFDMGVKHAKAKA
jgi:hypothetical protein